MLVNLVGGFSRVSLRMYIVAAMLASSPGLLSSPMPGRLGSINSLNEILSPPVLSALALLALLVLAPVLYKRLR